MTEDELREIERSARRAIDEPVWTLSGHIRQDASTQAENVLKVVAEIHRLQIQNADLQRQVHKMGIDLSQARHALDTVSGLSLGQDLP